MASGISSSVGVQAASQAALQQLKVQQAKQNAARAEQVANSLQTQAEDAQRVADRAQENARSLYVQSDQAHSAAGQARLGVAMMKTAGEMLNRVSGVASQVAARQQADSKPVADASSNASASTAPAPVVNTSGQVTGKVINTTA